MRWNLVTSCAKDDIQFWLPFCNLLYIIFAKWKLALPYLAMSFPHNLVAHRISSSIDNISANIVLVAACCSFTALNFRSVLFSFCSGFLFTCFKFIFNFILVHTSLNWTTNLLQAKLLTAGESRTYDLKSAFPQSSHRFADLPLGLGLSS